MNWRNACIWSSWSLLPMAALLLLGGSLLGWLYAASAAVAFGYHWSEQRRFYALDHALAWVCIAANCWLAWHTRDWQSTLFGVAGVVAALQSYFDAHDSPADYDYHHTRWHLWCGIAGCMLARGYLA